MRTQIPPVVKNLLIINALMFLALITFSMRGIDLNRILGMYYWGAPNFQPWQVVTHMFMHGGMMHIFFNMFALWMFGSLVEQRMGPERFLAFYLITGLGAAFLHMGVVTAEVHSMTGLFNIDVNNIGGLDLTDSDQRRLGGIYYAPMVGASGAVFGLLTAFAMFFPNMPLYLIFFPVPIKAKYLVLGYGAIELFSGFGRIPGDNIAHFAHLGGMLFGFILMKYWYK